MTVYIKRRSDFKTVAKGYASSWSLPLASAADDTGTVTLPGTDCRGHEGDFLILDGNIWLIQTVTIKDGTTTVKAGSILNVFDRSLPYVEPTGRETIGNWIYHALLSNYKFLDDLTYAMPYMTISNHDVTEFHTPEVKDGLYVLRDYIETVQRLYNIHLDFTISGDTLTVSIIQTTRPSTQIVFTDGHAMLDKETYSRTCVAKITTIQGDITIDWFLAEDGTISRTEPEHRAVGEWKTLVLKEKDVAAEKVAEQFSKNKCSHKIEFSSDRAYELYENIRVRLEDGSVVSSHITSIAIKSGTNRFSYQSGELATTLTETMKGVIQNDRNSGNKLR